MPVRVRWLAVLVLAAALPACHRPPKTVRIDGREVGYEEAARAAFASAEEAFTQKDLRTALDRFHAMAQQFPRSLLADDALFRTGQIYEGAGDTPNAARAYQTVVQQYASGDRAGEARFRLGITHVRAERWADAEESLRAYEKSPSGAPAQLAHARLLVAESLDRLQRPLDAAPFRFRAARSIEDPILAAWTRERALQAIRGAEVDPRLLQALVEEAAGDPAEAALRVRLAEARFAARDYADAVDAAKVVIERFAATPEAEAARSIVRRANARKNVDPSVVGVVVPLTGDFQAYGQKALQAIALAANAFGPDDGKRRVRLAVRDSAGDPERAAAAVDALFEEDGVIALVGPLLSNETEAAAARAQALGLPMITLAQKAGLTAAGPFVFRNSMTASMQARGIASHAVERLGLKRFAIMYPRTAYGEELAFLFWDEVVARGGEIVGVETYDPKENDFTDEVERLVGRAPEFVPARKEEWERLKAAAWKEQQRTGKKPKEIALPPVLDIEGLFVPDDYKRVGQLLPFFALSDVPIGGYTARNPNAKPTVPLGTNGWNNPELISRGGRYVEGAYFVDAFVPDAPEAKGFVERFVGSFLRVPDVLDALAFDSTSALVERVRAGASTRDKLRDALEEMRGFKGATGMTGFGKDRDAVRELTVLTVAEKEIRPYVAPPPSPTPNP